MRSAGYGVMIGQEASTNLDVTFLTGPPGTVPFLIIFKISRIRRVFSITGVESGVEYVNADQDNRSRKPQEDRSILSGALFLQKHRLSVSPVSERPVPQYGWDHGRDEIC